MKFGSKTPIEMNDILYLDRHPLERVEDLGHFRVAPHLESVELQADIRFRWYPSAFIE